MPEVYLPSDRLRLMVGTLTCEPSGRVNGAFLVPDLPKGVCQGALRYRVIGKRSGWMSLLWSGRESAGYAFQLRYEIAPAAQTLVEVA
jgi:hypothetical protein